MSSKTKIINIRMSDAEYAAMTAARKMEGKTQSQLVREAIAWRLRRDA